jgi:hypothetical protein
MEKAHDTTCRKRGRTASVLFGLLAVAVVFGTAATRAVPAAQASAAGSGLEQPPSAAEFAGLIAGSTTAYQKANRISARLADVHCVRASPTEYMCSYAVTSSDHARTCHLMQARWTPRSASLYAVTLTGLVEECATLREALQSLR